MFGPTWARRVWAAVLAGVVAFFVCSLLPLWRAYPSGAWCTFGSECNLWQLAERLAYPDEVVEWKHGAIVISVAVHLAMLAGAVLGGLGRRKEVRE